MKPNCLENSARMLDKAFNFELGYPSFAIQFIIIVLFYIISLSNDMSWFCFWLCSIICKADIIQMSPQTDARNTINMQTLKHHIFSWHL